MTAQHLALLESEAQHGNGVRKHRRQAVATNGTMSFRAQPRFCSQSSYNPTGIVCPYGRHVGVCLLIQPFTRRYFPYKAMISVPIMFAGLTHAGQTYLQRGQENCRESIETIKV